MATKGSVSEAGREDVLQEINSRFVLNNINPKFKSIMEEKTIFKGAPSQITNFGYYILCIILLPVLGLGLIMFLVRFLKTKFTKYEITNERIIEQTGVFSRRTDETEMYRVKDISLDEPFFLRMFGLSTITLVTSDKTSPIIKIYGVKDGNNLRKELRTAVDVRRDLKGVKERDFE
jgi:uncharacterized membrane protein YdbT with pleckstrin-like domain